MTAASDVTDDAEADALLPTEGEPASLPAYASVPAREHAAPAAAEPPVRGRRSLQGCIDQATGSGIEGWTWDAETPDERIQLELVEGDDRLLTAVAGDYRAGLDDAGIGDGRHAFAIKLKPGLLTEGRHVLQLRCAETGAPVPGSPIAIAVEAPLPEAETAFQWHLDEITDAGVSGWIAPRGGPLRHCVVALKDAGIVVARSVASLFRKDLQFAGIGDGCHAFLLQMPRTLLDGEVHSLEIIEEGSGFALTREPVQWRSTAGTAAAGLTGVGGAELEPVRPAAAAASGARAVGRSGGRAAAHVGTRMLFDISDLVYYISEHSNLTGIQRVQSSIVLAMIDGEVLPTSAMLFLSFNARTRNWVLIPTGFLISLLRDMFLPLSQRLIHFPAEDARYGVLPGAQPFDGTGVLDDGNPSVLCLLGAAWVHQDYIHRVLAWKRRFGTRFVMTVHDLIPIYARETCDQDTARVFEEFMHRALPHVDHVLAVSSNTAKDVRRYLASLQLPEPAITVTKNGSSFAEFMAKAPSTETSLLDLPERFVLFVATIKGRKNHQFIFDLWQRMVAEGDDPPHVICVGRLGWKATPFVSGLVETNYLDGLFHLLRDVSDTDLRMLYDQCMFTVCPTLYEGWGLPVGEALAMGRICVCSDRASIPEVAGECGVYVDIDDQEQSLAVIRNLVHDAAGRQAIEAKIRHDYVPITWRSVARRVAAACEASVNVKWQDPYPFTGVPYSTEISFGRLDHDVDGTGELLLTRILDGRMAHFTYDALDQRSFSFGELIRSGGAWAQPERWGTWLCHSGGDLVFMLPPDPSAYDYVFLRLRVCGVLHDHLIRLSANGERMWAGRIGPNSKDLMLRVRKRQKTGGYWKLRIAVDLDLSADLLARITALNGRVPTVGFERMIVVPENDTRARLDALSKFVASSLGAG